MRKRIILWTTGTAVVLLTWMYETYLGLPRYVEGHWVHRVSIPHTYVWWPLPNVKGRFFYIYTDANGFQVRHGPFWDYLENGRLSTTGYLLEGEPHGTWRHYDENGGVEGEALFDRGTLVRESNYFNPKR